MLPENTCIIETVPAALMPVKSAVVDYPPSAVCEEYLAERFARRAHAAPSVVCEITDDIALLHQYAILCQDRYAALFGLTEQVESSEIMIARAKNQAIGGCALTIKEPEAEDTLPMEKEGLHLASLFPLQPITSVRLMEISHMAMLPDFQESLVMGDMCHAVLRHAVSRNVRYAFALAPVALARTYSKAADKFGLTCNIFTHVAVSGQAVYEGEKLVLCLMDLAPVYAKKIKQKQRVGQKALIAG